MPVGTRFQYIVYDEEMGRIDLAIAFTLDPTHVKLILRDLTLFIHFSFLLLKINSDSSKVLAIEI